MSYRFIELALDGNLLVTVNDLMPFVFLMKTNCVSGPSCPAVVYTVYSIYTCYHNIKFRSLPGNKGVCDHCCIIIVCTFMHFCLLS